MTSPPILSNDKLVPFSWLTCTNELNMWEDYLLYPCNWKSPSPPAAYPSPSPLVKPSFYPSFALPAMEAAPDLVAGDDIVIDTEPNAEAVSSAVVEGEEEENTAAAAPVESPAEELLPPNEVAASVTQARIGGAGVWKCPRWPGDNVYRLIVPSQTVGSIIGRQGEAI